jgi:phosphopantetheinyl transferase
MKPFSTPEYKGFWLPFDGDRMQFRELIQNTLREALQDPNGTLTVDDQGPHWAGSKKIELSYSHSAGQGLFVFSHTHTLGVDIESEDRKFSQDALKLATRFFHVRESAKLKLVLPEVREAEFLKLWVKKEAHAKWTRQGISLTLHQPLPAKDICLIQSVPVCPIGFLGAVCFKKI